jgi:hypothetical protein
MIYGRGTGQKARGSAARQAADLRQLGNWLGAKDYGMGSRNVSYSRRASLEDAYGKSRGGGQGKKAPKKVAMGGSAPTSYGFSEHKGTWSTSKKK